MKVLEEANNLIYNDREESYGVPVENLKNISRLWSAYLTNIGTTNLIPKDVAMMMALLKMARAQVSSTPVRDHKDSVVDMAGYVGLLERLEETDRCDNFARVPNKILFNAPGNVVTVELNPSHPQVEVEE